MKEDFGLHDRVVRAGNPSQRGSVVEVYSSTTSASTGSSHVLYAVRWDGGVEERGYMRHGLQREPLEVTRA